jgi:hypothetical protein
LKQSLINYSKTGAYDEIYTPAYAVMPILEFIPKNKIIWCPFDTEESQYVKIFKQRGNDVIYSHKNENKDFFEYQPDKWDIIVSNPPYSIKNKVLKRCYELGKSFALLLPLTTLEGVERNKLFRQYGIQVLVLDKRINFLDYMKRGKNNSGNWFNSSYFCWKLLPKDLMFKEIKKV